MKKILLSAIAMLVLTVALAAQTHSVDLACAAAPGTSPTGFNFFRATAAGGEGSTPVNPSPVATCAFNDATVKAGTQYFYTATAIVGGVSSGQSNEVTGVIPVFAPSSAKLALSGTSGLVTWTASPDGTSAYNIYMGKSAGGESSTPVNSSPVAAGCSGATCTYALQSLVPGDTIFITVRATINGVLSLASNEASGTVMIPPPNGLTMTVR